MWCCRSGKGEKIMKTLKIVIVFVIGLVILLTGCAGARNMVKADDAKYDVSLSSAIRDSSGKVIPSERLETVGQYRLTASGWGILWSWVSLNSINLSKSINDQVAKVGGSAITNLSANVNGGILNYFPILN